MSGERKYQVYQRDWAGEGWEGVMSSFSVPEEKRDVPDEVLAAIYTYEDYSGDAWVVYMCDGGVYEVNGSHCSCYGLEEQWRPEGPHDPAVFLECLERRLANEPSGVEGVMIGDVVERLRLIVNPPTHRAPLEQRGGRSRRKLEID